VNKQEWKDTAYRVERLGPELSNGDETIENLPAWMHPGDFFVVEQPDGLFWTIAGNEDGVFPSLDAAQDWLWPRANMADPLLEPPDHWPVDPWTIGHEELARWYLDNVGAIPEHSTTLRGLAADWLEKRYGLEPASNEDFASDLEEMAAMYDPDDGELGQALREAARRLRS
jgi:hypothetical protein